MKQYIFIIVATTTLFFSSCRKEYPEVYNPVEQSTFYNWSDVFESYWNAMNYSYAFWDVDPTDWDQVYVDYKPQFEGLEFGKSEDSTKVVELFTELTSTLVDHHYLLSLKNPDGSYFATINPAIAEVSKRDYYHSQLDPGELYSTCMSHVESGRYTNGRAEIYEINPENHMLVYSFLIEESIVYFHYNTCELAGAIYRYEDEKIIDVINHYHSLIEETTDLKGIIIDTRSNTGGYLWDTDFTIRPLLKEDLQFAYSHTKAGMGRLDYTPWTPWIISADPESPITRDLSDVKIVSLIDVWSVSMGEMTSMAIGEMPNGTIIGERSFGGHGPLNNDYTAYYAGTLENKAYQMKTSTSSARHMDGKSYEGIGVIPDIEALYNDEEFKKGNDTQLERAIEFIKTGK